MYVLLSDKSSNVLNRYLILFLSPLPAKALKGKEGSIIFWPKMNLVQGKAGWIHGDRLVVKQLILRRNSFGGDCCHSVVLSICLPRMLGGLSNIPKEPGVKLIMHEGNYLTVHFEP